MGVSLERVQFKFASIVGELCNEPDVLSQFAVWLDLRLAEYKLKGAISLDCSGEEPEADWMDGLSKCKMNQKDRRHYSNINHRQISHEVDHPRFSNHYNSHMDSERLAANVKKEMHTQEDVYPVEMHRLPTMPSSASKKRHAPINPDSWPENVLASSAKHRRYSSSSSSPINQSLMSVIGNVAQENTDRGGNSIVTIDDNAHSYSPLSSQDRTTDTVILSETSESTPVNADSLPSSSSFDTSLEQSPNQLGASGKDFFMVKGRSIEQGGLDLQGDVDIDTRRHLLAHSKASSLVALRKSRLGDVSSIPKKSVTNMVAAVGYFEKWLWTCHKDFRWITEIPVEELDPYLAEFFTNVKPPTGAEYTLDAYVAFRAYLSRYLKHYGYPEIITTSAHFPQSQEAFRIRRQQLSQKIREML